MSHKTISANRAPAAIGPYSQAVIHEGILYCSGQIALDPDSMEIIEGGVKEQTNQVMNNISAILAEAGSGLDKVLKCSIFLDDMEDFPVVNEVYGSYFKDNLPARETVAVQSLPKNVQIEISCIARV